MTDRITEIRTAHAKHAYASEAAISDLLAELDKRDAEIAELREENKRYWLAYQNRRLRSELEPESKP